MKKRRKQRRRRKRRSRRTRIIGSSTEAVASSVH
jgi:hypothetical protein